MSYQEKLAEDTFQHSDVLIPHFSLPFRFIDQGLGYPTAAIHQQDTHEEILHCVETVLRYVPDQRPEKPEFGSPDFIFEQAPVDTSAAYNAIARWEPRASVAVEESADLVDELVTHITVGIEAAKRGGENR